MYRQNLHRNGRWLLMVVSLATSICSCKSLPEQEIHIIPANYRGPVVILFDQENGANPEYEGEARVYRVGNDGILRTKMVGQTGGYLDGWVRFYLEQPNSVRRELPVVENRAKREEVGVVSVFDESYGSLSLQDSEHVHFMLYMVGSPSDTYDVESQLDKALAEASRK